MEIFTLTLCICRGQVILFFFFAQRENYRNITHQALRWVVNTKQKPLLLDAQVSDPHQDNLETWHNDV